MADETRGWLADALSRRTRHPELEQTLFHRLQQLEKGPIEQLGELVRAVIDELRLTQHRLADQTRDLASLQQTVASLTGRLDELAARVPAAPAVAEGHVLLLPTRDGYRLVERAGPPPLPGDSIEHDGGRYRALSRNASPFPGDGRACLLALAD
jgi:hypothetical protein